MSVVIKSVVPGGRAAHVGLRAGDVLVSINGNEIMDVLDYRFYQGDEELLIEFVNEKGVTKKKKVKKTEYEELGLLFDTYLMDKQRACKNRCIFCFIDQLPRGMRKSLYFKDDDSRLSFLFGNYITLTNITEHEVERIIKMHISPINVSVHTTNPELRVKMMRNPDAGKALKVLSRLNDAGIAINCQLVLCPGYNDGAELERTLNDLVSMRSVQCIASVPVGLTKYREGLTQLELFKKDTAAAVLDIIDRYASTGRVFAADEFYLLAGREIPPAKHYGDFYQLENGVGMWALLRDEAEEALSIAEKPEKAVKLSIATGEAAYPLIINIVDRAAQKWHNLNCNVYAVKNDFFGHNIKVAGLVTGGDIIKQLKDKPLGDCLLIPDVMLRRENDMFLDDVTVEELSHALGVRVKVVGSGGDELISALRGE